MGSRFVTLRAAKEWGVLPSAVGICQPDDDLTYMVAYIRTESAMRELEAQEMEREAKRGKNRA